MADQPTCYARDLTSDAVGKTVVFEKDARKHTDELLAVFHDVFGTTLYLAGLPVAIRVNSEKTLVEVRRSPEGQM